MGLEGTARDGAAHLHGASYSDPAVNAESYAPTAPGYVPAAQGYAPAAPAYVPAAPAYVPEFYPAASYGSTADAVGYGTTGYGPAPSYDPDLRHIIAGILDVALIVSIPILAMFGLSLLFPQANRLTNVDGTGTAERKRRSAVTAKLDDEFRVTGKWRTVYS
jgi:hypothetical protein